MVVKGKENLIIVRVCSGDRCVRKNKIGFGNKVFGVTINACFGDLAALGVVMMNNCVRVMGKSVVKKNNRRNAESKNANQEE